MPTASSTRATPTTLAMTRYRFRAASTVITPCRSQSFSGSALLLSAEPGQVTVVGGQFRVVLLVPLNDLGGGDDPGGVGGLGLLDGHLVPGMQLVVHHLDPHHDHEDREDRPLEGVAPAAHVAAHRAVELPPAEAHERAEQSCCQRMESQPAGGEEPSHVNEVTAASADPDTTPGVGREHAGDAGRPGIALGAAAGGPTAPG